MFIIAIYTNLFTGSKSYPFYCLLENDSLVTELNVTTDRLLTPLKDGQHPNEVVLIIKVKVKATMLNDYNMNFVS